MKHAITPSARSAFLFCLMPPRQLVMLLLFALLTGCNSSDTGAGPTPPILCTAALAPTGTAISGYAPTDGASDGVFDSSLTEDGCNRIWMSYSAVRNTVNGLRLVSTRIARANDLGTGWEDIGVTVNNAVEYTVNPVGPLTGTWEQEVSRLVYDPYTSDANQRWKLLWHRYRWEQTSVGSAGSPLFQHGWIALKTAPDPSGPWSAERKLFVGSLYDTSNNSTIGPPEYNLHTLNAALGGCLVFTEPGMLATASGVYISLKCATGAGGAGNVVLVRCDNQVTPGSCTYRGTLLAGTEAGNYNNAFGLGANSFTGFSATELVQVASKNYLLVTPTESDNYRGCFTFEIGNLESASLVRDLSGVATLHASLRGTPGSFNGACGHSAGNTALGILYSELVLSAHPFFRIFASGQSP
jgi:hypothetical protein